MPRPIRHDVPRRESQIMAVLERVIGVCWSVDKDKEVVGVAGSAIYFPCWLAVLGKGKRVMTGVCVCVCGRVQAGLDER